MLQITDNSRSTDVGSLALSCIVRIGSYMTDTIDGGVLDGGGLSSQVLHEDPSPS